VSPILESIGSVKGFGWGALLASTSYESIATTTVGSGGTATITFSSIPATYTHLQIRGIAGNTTGTHDYNTMTATFNSDTAANYSIHRLYGQGTTAVVQGYANTSNMYVGATNNNALSYSIYSPVIIDILDYANTNKYKTVRVLAGNEDNSAGYGVIYFNSGSWRSTSAISSIAFLPGSGNFAQYSQLALYGIKG
jgi:hypothetical protein